MPCIPGSAYLHGERQHFLRALGAEADPAETWRPATGATPLAPQEDWPTQALALLERLVAYRPEDRPRNAADIATTLDSLHRAARRGSAKTAPPTNRPTPTRVPAVRPAIRIVADIVILATGLPLIPGVLLALEQAGQVLRATGDEATRMLAMSIPTLEAVADAFAAEHFRPWYRRAGPPLRPANNPWHPPARPPPPRA